MIRFLILLFAAITTGCVSINDQIVAVVDNAEDFVVDTAVAVSSSLDGEAPETSDSGATPSSLEQPADGALIESGQFASDSVQKVERSVAAGPVIGGVGGVPLKEPDKREVISRHEPENYMAC